MDNICVLSGACAIFFVCVCVSFWLISDPRHSSFSIRLPNIVAHWTWHMIWSPVLDFSIFPLQHHQVFKPKFPPICFTSFFYTYNPCTFPTFPQKMRCQQCLCKKPAKWRRPSAPACPPSPRTSWDWRCVLATSLSAWSSSSPSSSRRRTSPSAQPVRCKTLIVWSLGPILNNFPSLDYLETLQMLDVRFFLSVCHQTSYDHKQGTDYTLIRTIREGGLGQHLIPQCKIFFESNPNQQTVANRRMI